MAGRRKLVVMVSSSIYGIEELLDQIFATLNGFGYKVWMSHKGSIPVNSRLSNKEICLKAVDECDVFLGLITGRYGAVVDRSGRSLTHNEVLRAIERNKLRWFLVHHDVVVARSLLRQFRFNDAGSRNPLDFKKTPYIDDIRVLEMYEDAIREELPVDERTGNWAQEFSNNHEVLEFITNQLSDLGSVRKLLTGQ